jgi:hypothetical protein
MPPTGMVTRTAPVPGAAPWTTVAGGRLSTFVDGGHGPYGRGGGRAGSVIDRHGG